MLGLDPDVVFIGTGGIPNMDILEAGEDLVVSSWDVLSGQVKLAERVLARAPDQVARATLNGDVRSISSPPGAGSSRSP